jgi:hypothetical protein
MTQIESGTKSLPTIESSCCAPALTPSTDSELHAGLTDLLRRYNVNDYAASVRVFAVKQG